MRKGRNAKQIEEALPEIADNPDVMQAAEILDQYQEIEAFTKHPGGRLVIKQRIDRAGIMLSDILAKARGEHTHLDLLRMLTRLESEINLISSLTSASTNAEEQQKIVDALIEQVS